MPNSMMFCGLALLLAVQAFGRDEYSRNFDKTVTLPAAKACAWNIRWAMSTCAPTPGAT